MGNTSSTANYTPTMAALPWKIGADSHVYDADGHFVTVSGFHFTVTGGYYIPSKLNTTFIVRAVNSHEQLVAALRDLLPDAVGNHIGGPDTQARIDAARAALAAAEV